uniref:Uncharacterized protein n=1 Tax=Knipowitschia caucasica TaxID=637954 RepID=A0AAV2M3E4_KNICA
MEAIMEMRALSGAEWSSASDDKPLCLIPWRESFALISLLPCDLHAVRQAAGRPYTVIAKTPPHSRERLDARVRCRETSNPSLATHFLLLSVLKAIVIHSGFGRGGNDSADHRMDKCPQAARTSAGTWQPSHRARIEAGSSPSAPAPTIPTAASRTRLSTNNMNSPSGRHL